jgi:hypothetical protein
MTTVHDFKTSLQQSHAQSGAPWWETVYREAFPGFATMTDVRQDGWAQRGGIDRVVVLRDGTTLKVDEKVRYETYPDILLEFWSDKDRQIPGWIEKDLTCDFIAYAFVPSATCFLFPFHTLRRAWDENKVEWGLKAGARTEGFRYVDADNGSYITRSCAVPLTALRAALTDAMVIHWSNQ